MRIPTDLPRLVRSVEHVPIEVRDGTRLAGRLWLPEGAEAEPVPLIFEFIPYRRRDGTRIRDEISHPYLAAHGYACLRVDLRGSGDSEGVLTDEYLEQEHRDAEDVLAWAAQQPWCDGNAGMMGISWGGFNALQLAARRPPQLKAVAAVAATDDRYRDDVHYMGGCLLIDNLSWASVMFSFNGAPPDPAIVGDAWRSMWIARLEDSGMWLNTWLRHQRRDEYWRHGSIREDYSAIDVPVLVASGWADGYTNAVFRMLEHLEVPRLGLVGPWGHTYPHLGSPGPAIGFLQELVRWWDRWLKGVANGIEDEPMLRAYVQDSVAPAGGYDERPGRWVAEPSWPSPNVERRTYLIDAERRLRPEPTRHPAEIVANAGDGAPTSTLSLHSPVTLGLHAGKWCSYAVPPDLPGDQRLEDGGALVFDSEPLETPIEVLGSPVVHLTLTADRPVAMVAVRLSDVLPDNRVTRVTYGLLNLTHRHGHDDPQPLVPGERVRVAVRLNDVGYAFPHGHRLRVAVSSSYWPLAWLPPEPVTLSVVTGACAMDLPVRLSTDPQDIVLPPAVGLMPTEMKVVEPGDRTWRVLHDLATETSTLEVVDDWGSVILEEPELTIERRRVERYTVRSGDVTSARGETEGTRSYRRGDWQVRTETRTDLSCDADNFRIRADIDAYEGDTRVFARSWDRTIPRDLV